MNSFDFSLYDYEDENDPIKIEKPEKSTKNFDFSLYDEEGEEEKPYALQYSHLTPKEYEKLPPEKKKQLQEYNPLTGFSKGLASGATLGFSEKFDPMKIQEHEVGSGFGSFLGSALPISGIAKLVSYPIKAISGLVNFGKIGKFGLGLGSSGTTGATYSLGKQAIKGEGIEPAEVAEEAALFAGAHLGFETIFKGIPGGINWINSLKTGQKAELLVKGKIPDNLTPHQFKFYETEIAPKIIENAEMEYKQGLQKAIEENDLNYKKELEKIKSNHEHDLYKKSQKQRLSEEEYEQSKQEYQLQVKNLTEEYEAKTSEIQKENDIAQKEFEESRNSFEKMKRREKIVRDAIQRQQTTEINLKGRITDEASDISLRPTPAPTPKPSLKNKVGEVISRNDIESTAPDNRGNTTTAGKQLIEGIRANDAIDYAEVNEAYRISDELNKTVKSNHPSLILDLQDIAEEINLIPEASPPQKQLLNAINKIISKLGEFDEAGNLVGLSEVSNDVLLEQAKAFRYFMDFDFSHGNARGIFSPTVKLLEEAAERASNITGNQSAYQASAKARNLYRNWTEDYDNPYIKPLRDRTNKDYSKTFKSTSNLDEFNAVNRILSKSNAGQQISNIARRELVQNHLKKFMDNPRLINQEEFNETLRELRAVITSEEEQSIREQFAEARRTPVIKGEKIKNAEIKEPKLKEIPPLKIPKFKGKIKNVEEITKVNLPEKPEIKQTTAMKNAARMMKITPEELQRMGNDVSGFRKIKDSLKNLPALVEKLNKDKIRQIFFEGNVERKFTGGELYSIINKGNNYALIEEILGKEAAEDLLVSAKELENKKATVDTLKKVGTKIGTIKSLILFGIL